MSILLVGQIFELRIEPAGKKLVYLAFADAANADGYTWMALESQRGKLDIRTKTSMSLRAVRTHVGALEKEGRLERVKNLGKGCMWRVVIARTEAAGQQETRPADIVESPAEFASKPLSNRQDKKNTRGGVQPLIECCPVTGRPLPSYVSGAQWTAFLDMRLSQGKKVGAYVAQYMLRKLAEIAKAGWHPGDVLDRSTVNAWADVYEPDVGRVTGVRQLVSGKVGEPVGMSDEDKAELVRIAAIESIPEMLAARRAFMASVEKRNKISPT